MKMTPLFGEPSWELHSDRTSLAVTRDGGQMAPVEFDLGGRTVDPFHVAPWAGSKEARALPPILRVLRGDFFCMPFGGNSKPFRKEQHPVHGETANAPWAFVGRDLVGDWSILRLELETKIRPAKVEKTLALHAGQTAIYCRHVIRGGRGPMSFGHHAMLNFQGDSGRISTSPFFRGQVYPGAFENPVSGGYSSLKAGAIFSDLARVPAADGSMADLTRYPAREGFEDLVMLSSKPGANFAWTAAVFEKGRYVWFSLKDPGVLASTVMWHSNGGRHYAPWNGRHRGVLGLEEVTSYFHDGLAESAAANALSHSGVETHKILQPKKPLTVSVIMGVAAVPRGFDVVRTITPEGGGIKILSHSGKTVIAPLDTAFLENPEEE